LCAALGGWWARDDRDARHSPNARTNDMSLRKKSAAKNSWRDAGENVKEAAVEKLEDLTDKVEDGLSSMSKYVKFGSAPEILLRLRKQFRLQIPILPDVVVTAGTDVPLQRENDGEAFGKEIFNYQPNLQWRVTDSWFNGDINLDTRNHTIFYEKTFDLDVVQLKLSGNFDYKDHEPYFGFQFLTTNGVTSPATMNGFSIRKNVELQDNDTFSLNTNFEASLILGATTVGRSGGKNKGSLTTSPATVDFSRIELDLMIK
jgi:hypothetical protein